MAIEDYSDTIVNKLEFLQDVTKVHGEVDGLISRDYVFAHIPEEKKEPLAKLIKQFYYGYWLKLNIMSKDPNCTKEDKELIKTIAKEALSRQLVEYHIYVNLKRNERSNPLLELTINENKDQEMEEPEPMNNTEAAKTMLKGKTK